jgi:hypothetical protein
MTQMQDVSHNRQKGAVSLFIVIFTALLFTTITISFVQLMVRDQQQATNSDLSESAYDSAIAGVEDAKRALLLQQECIGSTSQRCLDIRAAINSGSCDTVARIFPQNSVDGEVEIRQSAQDRDLEQAYTCVKITPDTADFLGSASALDSVEVIPLRAKEQFDRVVLSWYLSKSGGSVNLPAAGSTPTLPRSGATNWPSERPSLLRTQLINGSGHGSFRLSDFDNSTYSNTLFLYPSRVGSSALSFSVDGRRSGSTPQQVRCQTTVSSGQYACQVELMMTAPVSAQNSRNVFLALSAFYNPTDFRIELRNGSTPVLFDGVQPEVDSTGRANDLFRRVVSRVEIGDTFRYPLAALETRGNLCKSFSVTTEPSDYQSNCTP